MRPYGAQITYDDEMFGLSVFEVSDYEVEETADKVILDIKGNKIELLKSCLLKIVLVASLETRLEMIQEAKSLPEAMAYCQEKLSPDEEWELDELKKRLLPDRVDEFFTELRSSIGVIITARGSKLSANEVLGFIKRNYTHGSESLSYGEIHALRKQLSKEKLEEIINEMQENIF